VPNICLIPDCCQPSGQLFDGKPYCQQHYRERFIATLMAEYNAWQIDTSPSKRMKYMLGRFEAEYCRNIGESYLSAARIRDRGFAFRKTDIGAEFSITRHLNAWSASKTMHRSVETWSCNLTTQEFIRSSTREWTPEDPK
jgi:hypothetical protein